MSTTDPISKMVEHMDRHMTQYLVEVLNMAIHDGIITEDQARAVLPLPKESRDDGRTGPLGS